MLGRRTKRERERELALTHALQQDYTRLFVDVARALTSTLQLEVVLTNIMEKMAQFFGNERWSMMLVDKEKNDLYYVIAVGEDKASLSGLAYPHGRRHRRLGRAYRQSHGRAGHHGRAQVD